RRLFRRQRRDAARAALPRRGRDPLRHREGRRALSRAAAGLALRLQHLPRELRRPAMSDAITFIRGTPTVALGNADPNTTVPNYPRLQEGSCGTKEGCAEGDCGACTVVLGELDGDHIRYRAVNSCIQFLPTLHGKQLITVEDLKEADGSLHPVQQAMVEMHGSQCGFCTPGFVMSLFTLFHADGTLDRCRIDDALAGNLCRCTGYGPI